MKARGGDSQFPRVSHPRLAPAAFRRATAGRFTVSRAPW